MIGFNIIKSCWAFSVAGKREINRPAPVIRKDPWFSGTGPAERCNTL